MKYLITGATGFVGPYLIRRLAGAGHFARCLVRDQKKAEYLKELPVETVWGDITKPETLDGIADGVDRVLHLATLGHMSNYTVTESMFMKINVEGTMNVMAQALRSGVKRIVHCSSVAAMGICPESPADETTPCRPHHSYGRSKLQAEQEVLKMCRKDGLPASIVRFSMVYGPGDFRDILRISRMAKKWYLPKIGKRPKLTPLIHAEDAVAGLLLAAEKGSAGEIYLLTNEQSEPFDGILKTIRDALGIQSGPIYVPEWAAMGAARLCETMCRLAGKPPIVTRKNIESTLADRVFSIDKAKQELGFKPRIDPEPGLRETVEWYIKKGWI